MPETQNQEQAPAPKAKRAEKISKVLVNKSRSIVISVAVVLVLAIGTAIALDVSSKADLKGWDALVSIAQQETKPTADDYVKIADDNKGGSAEPQALLIAATMYLTPPTEDANPTSRSLPKRLPETESERTARLQKAQGVLERIIASFPTNECMPRVKNLLGATLEEQGEYAKAVDVLLALDNEIEMGKFKNVSTTQKVKFKYDLGRNYYMLGKKDEAKQYVERAAQYDGVVYTRAGAETPDWVEKARYLETLIGIGEEALDVTPPPPAIDVTPPSAPPAPPTEEAPKAQE